MQLFFIKLGAFGSLVYATQAVRLVFYDQASILGIQRPNIFTKKVNHTYISMVLISIPLLYYLLNLIIQSTSYMYVNAGVSYLVVFYKILFI